MNKFHSQFWMLTLLALLTVSCIDNNYDLSDIDTNAQFKVTDLTVPINIDEIKLDNILEINDGDRIKKIGDKYAICENGHFNSSQIKIDPIFSNAPTVDTEYIDMTIIRHDLSVEYPIKDSNGSQFEYTMENVSDDIVSIDNISTDLKMDVYFTIPKISGQLTKISFDDLNIQFPKGLTLRTSAGEYNPETGILQIGHIESNGDKLIITTNIDKVDFNKSTAQYDYKNHHFDFIDKLNIISGKAIISNKDISGGNLSAMPEQATLNIDYKLSNITVNAISGEIKHTINDIDISPIDISDLPDILIGERTEIQIVNPQIYLKINNPLSRYNVSAQTGLELTAIRNNQSDKTYSLDNGKFIIGYNNADGIYKYCMSPKMPQDIFTGYADAEHVPFSSLSKLLTGGGLPQKIEVSLNSPSVPTQRVIDIPLGVNLGNIVGDYDFVAPFQLENGSILVLGDKLDGWSSDDLDAVAIEKLIVTANITTTLPIDFEVTAYPINNLGEKINNVDIIGANVSAHSNEQPIEISITGQIDKLDGIVFEAIAISKDSGTPLSPSQTIKLNNLRAKVSGYYNKEL